MVKEAAAKTKAKTDVLEKKEWKMPLKTLGNAFRFLDFARLLLCSLLLAIAIPKAPTVAAAEATSSDLHTKIQKIGGVTTKDPKGNIVAVSFGFGKWSDAHIALLRQIPTLRFLQIDDHAPDEIGTINVPGLTHLSVVGNVGMAFIDAVCRSRSLKSLKLGMPITDKQLERLARDSQLTELGLAGVDDQQMSLLGEMESLKSLMIPCNLGALSNYPDPSDKGLASLGKLKNLERLIVLSPNVSGTGIASFKHHKKLRQLILGEYVTDEGLKSIAQLKNLTFLGLSTNPINTKDVCTFTERGVAELEGLEKLEELHLLFGNTLTDDALKSIGNLPNLIRLNLAFIDISNEGIKHLEKCRRLESLTLGPLPGTQLTARGAANIGKLRRLRFLCFWNPTDHHLREAFRLERQDPRNPPALGNLKSLMLLGADRITDDGIDHLSQLKNLEYLFVDSSHVGNRSVESLSKLTQLRVLCMDDTSVTDQGITTFARFKALDEVSVARTKVSHVGRVKLRALGFQRGGDCFVNGRPTHKFLEYVPSNLISPWGDYVFPFEFETVDIRGE